MEKKSFILIAVIAMMGYSSQAQVLKNFGKRIENKIEQRIDRKADRSVDKVLDKGDKKTDEPLDKILNGSSNKSKDSRKSTKPSGQKEKKEKAERVLLSENVEAKPGEVMIMTGSDCKDFIWFKKGALLSYNIEDGKGKTLERQRMEISDVKTSGSHLVAEVRLSDKKDNTFDLQYKCIGDQIYMDFSGMMRQAMEKGAAGSGNSKMAQEIVDNTEFSVTEGNMGFPKKMYPGMKLDDLAFSMKSGTEQVKVAVNVEVFDRHVNRKETIETEAGKFDCLVIINQVATSMNVLGRDREMPVMLQLQWFSPDIGLIKQETYDKDLKLESKMELTEYKL